MEDIIRTIRTALEMAEGQKAVAERDVRDYVRQFRYRLDTIENHLAEGRSAAMGDSTLTEALRRACVLHDNLSERVRILSTLLWEAEHAKAKK